MITVAGGVPELSYVQYAFGKHSEKKIFFYFPAEVGENRLLGNEHYTYISSPTGNNIIPAYDFAVIFSGIIILVTTSEIHEFKVKLIDRLRCLQYPTPLGMYKIIIDWSNEPQPLS
jgi:hypothetical protein